MFHLHEWTVATNWLMYIYSSLLRIGLCGIKWTRALQFYVMECALLQYFRDKQVWLNLICHEQSSHWSCFYRIGLYRESIRISYSLQLHVLGDGIYTALLLKTIRQLCPRHAMPSFDNFLGIWTGCPKDNITHELYPCSLYLWFQMRTFSVMQFL